jgi:predicted permease
MIPLLLAVADSDGGRHGQWKQVLWQTLRNLATNPMIWGIVGGFLFSLSGWTMPAPLGRTINLFAQASAVLSLFVIGGSLVGLELKSLKGTVSQVTLGKLFLHPLAIWGVLTFVSPVSDPDLRLAALLSGALPMMSIYTILSQRHGHGTISAASLLLTTVVSFFTLSALLWVLQHPFW